MADNNKKQARDPQNHLPDNAGLQHKLTEKQSPADTDKGGLSSKTSHSDDGGSQRANVSTNGFIDRPSVSEIGTEKQREKNRILNEQVKDPEDTNNAPKK
ncbi:hypothetical protein [Cesiribacter sp. SM1]|uniref:hypothetical protein n=1 Tax=Cesiribacter sp. SM1 TaxID=2861196 RepID=UPI001CD51352|nr:hypothetical protein [Cesiribacter sp. SM1]